MHFQTWQDKAGNAPPLTDPATGLTFPDLNAGGAVFKPNRIMPERQEEQPAIQPSREPEHTPGA